VLCREVCPVSETCPVSTGGRGGGGDRCCVASVASRSCTATISCSCPPGRGVSDEYGVKDAACPLSTKGGGGAPPPRPPPTALRDGPERHHARHGAGRGTRGRTSANSSDGQPSAESASSDSAASRSAFRAASTLTCRGASHAFALRRFTRFVALQSVALQSNAWPLPGRDERGQPGGRWGARCGRGEGRGVSD